MEELYDIKAANRLRSFRIEFVNKSQRQAAKQLDIEQAMLSRVEAGKNKIPFELVTKLVKSHKLNTEWLTTGKGNKTDNTPPAKNTLITDIEALNIELETLKKAIKIIELNQTYLIKTIDRQNKVIEGLKIK